MITEDYVSFETAKLLKEKGFENSEPTCINVFKGHTYKIQDNEIIADDDVTIPTLQMAMKWLREVHNLFISISTWLRHKDGTVQYCYEIRNLNDKDFKTAAGCTITEFDSYEKTGEAAIKCCLENLI